MPLPSLSSRASLTLAHSPDPDDVFMWWPVTGKIDPSPDRRASDGCGEVIEPPRIDTGRFTFRALPADIAVLNRRAIEKGDLDITALSMFTWAHVRERYVLTACGSSMGYGYGPKLVARGSHEAQRDWREGTIAVPGMKTTAFLLLSLILKEGGAGRRTPTFVEMPFDQILEAVGSGGAGAGLLIHQSQLTYADRGLVELVDLGKWWLDRTGLPLALGGNALRRDIETRFGTGSLREITGILERSIRYALDHREESTEYAMRFAPEISRAQADRYIDMYVNELTVDAGEVGGRAIKAMLDEAHRAGMAPRIEEVEMLRG